MTFAVDYDWLLKSALGTVTAESEEHPEFQATEAQRRRIVRGMLKRLSPRHRRLLMLFGSGRTYQQIGDEFGLSRDGAHHAVRRTLKIAADDLAKHHGITSLRQI